MTAPFFLQTRHPVSPAPCANILLLLLNEAGPEHWAHHGLGIFIFGIRRSWFLNISYFHDIINCYLNNISCFLNIISCFLNVFSCFLVIFLVNNYQIPASRGKLFLSFLPTWVQGSVLLFLNKMLGAVRSCALCLVTSIIEYINHYLKM